MSDRLENADGAVQSGGGCCGGTAASADQPASAPLTIAGQADGSGLPVVVIGGAR